MLSKINLYPKIGNKDKTSIKIKSKLILNILSYCDGTNSIEEISQKCNMKLLNCKILENLNKKKLVNLIEYLL